MKRSILAFLLCLLALLLSVSSCGVLTTVPEPTGESTADETGSGEPDDPERPGGQTTEGKTEEKTEEKTDGMTGEGTTVPEKPKTRRTYLLTSGTRGIKVLGVRNLAENGKITCDWTGSGIEFDVDSQGGDIVVTAKATAQCYFRAYVDGEAWGGKFPLMSVTTAATELVIADVPEGPHRIRLIKVTGYTLARAELTELSLYGSIVGTAPADRDLYIEFVGDSICCGWGNIAGHTGVAADQDGSRAYPYLVADALNADYAVTALSGQGLLYGNPGVTRGYNYASPLRSTAAEYDFARQADLVVINIGTNDYSHRTDAGITEDDFYSAYLAFLRNVKTKNGEGCRIVCIYNTMNDTFANAIQRAVAKAGGEQKGIHLLEFARTASGHPTLAEHAAYAEVLTAFLRDLPEIPEVPVEQGDPRGMFVAWDELTAY